MPELGAGDGLYQEICKQEKVSGLKSMLVDLSVQPANSQMTTQRLLVNYKYLANGLGLLLTSSYNLN